ncbi:hypothetical protein ZIOFF_068124 [Zingiber officinale]|uniref:XPG-I domain-containing protein n=1 Tax=Zingiber officinale TaxID=94328 RepID=A0A8J5ET57_ZINOF|nr:hypothetical protein ZIOFF_068124 [Zingiber officinale]
MSHVLGALLASSPLLAQAWTRCLRANAGSANFVIDRSDDAVFITFSWTQAVALSSGLGRGFFEPVSLYSNTHDIFAPLGRGEEDDGGKPQPMLLQASALHLFMSLSEKNMKTYVYFSCKQASSAGSIAYCKGIRILAMASLFIVVSVHVYRTTAEMAPKPLDYELLNENVKKVAYAVKGELYLRASELQKEGKKTGDLEGIEKYSKRTVKVTKQHNEDCKRLLRLMGVPTIEVFAVASENMDTLTFGVPRFLHHLMDPSSKKIFVMEFDVSKVLEELRLTMDQFIDLCILSGCDYCDNIKGQVIREA